MDRLKDKIAVVTGATSGIGEAVARMYVKEGAKVVCIGRNKEKGAALVQELEAAGGEAIFVPADLRVKADIENIKAKALERFGRVDILFNAAGVLVHKPFLEHTDEDFDLITETNCRAYIWMMQAFIPVMLEQGKGNIINVASISAIWPELNAYYYGAMKAAIATLSKNVAKEFSRQGIRVNCILPGPINTNMTPDNVKNSKEVQQDMIDHVVMVGRLGEPDDIAYGAVYLGSDESEFVTGQQLVIDGGVTISN
ncbi:MAG: SDR family oxidoreductase [Lachnospiraceae bacterium]|nr:SDR family oxidoreductase [Lachnospiraceae bacterium]MCR5538809.1 SDR family oxidoreductase [Lachnospiraceae bacterium]